MVDNQDPKDYWSRRHSRIDEILESWRTAAGLASTLIKSAILLNGAAAIALLAFIGAKSANSAEIPIEQYTHSMQQFLIGVFSGALASCAAYLGAQLENRTLWAWVRNSPSATRYEKAQIIFHVLAFVLIVYAYVRFWWGIETGIDALKA